MVLDEENTARPAISIPSSRSSPSERTNYESRLVIWNDPTISWWKVLETR